MSDFTGLKAIVTGGASGSRAATATMLAERGAKVVVIDRQKSLNPVDGIHFLFCDIQSREEVDRVVGEAASLLGGIDVVVNNAGIGATGDVSIGDDEEWHRVYDINVVAAARVSSASLSFLRNSKNSAIVNVSSVVAIVNVSSVVAMAADHVKDGIRVNCVMPGTADIPWVGRLLEVEGNLLSGLGPSR